MSSAEEIKNIFTRYNISITTEQSEQIFLYKQTLLVWNEKINLISKPSVPLVDIMHLVDSALPLSLIPDKGPIIDLGTGGGMPGIIIKILRPHLKVTLSETKTKKIKFLQNCLQILNLDGIDICNPAQEKPQRIYSLLVSRAFGTLRKIIQESTKYLKQDGIIAAYKGRNQIIQEETNKLPGKYKVEILPYEFLNGDEKLERNLVLIHN